MDKKRINVCARGEEKRERWDDPAQWMDYLEMSHPAQGVSVWQTNIRPPRNSDSHMAEICRGWGYNPGTRKYCRCPGDKPSIVQRTVGSNKRICGETIESFRLEKMPNMITFTINPAPQWSLLNHSPHKCHTHKTSEHFQTWCFHHTHTQKSSETQLFPPLSSFLIQSLQGKTMRNLTEKCRKE